MAYKKITRMDIMELFRQWQAQRKGKHIAESMGIDRKTVRKYLNKFKAKGLTLETSIEDKEQLPTILQSIVKEPEHDTPAQNMLEPHLTEIAELIGGARLKMTSAYEVIGQRYELFTKVSLSSFKRFVQAHHLLPDNRKNTCRMETPPGKEVQIDYAKMGYLRMPDGTKKTVYAFIASASYSRHKYVDFVFSQDQKSFIASHVRMFDYFGGVFEMVNLDNLKTGVIKADRYNPMINRAYQELANHYGFFVHPCRVRSPQDKGKVERDVQTIREQFKKFLALDPNLDLASANRRMAQYLKEEYGQKPHGTTREKPYLAFSDLESPALKALPIEPFVIAEWKEVKVHPDCYIQFNKKSYSVPYAYVGKSLWVRAADKLLSVYDDHKLIKQHVITSYHLHTDHADFPPNVQAALDEGLPDYLQRQALNIGKNFHALVRKTLQPHAFMNLRKAQGLLSLKDKYPHHLIEQASAIAIEHRTMYPQLMESMLIKLQEEQKPEEPPLVVSDESTSFVREITYFHQPFIHHQPNT